MFTEKKKSPSFCQSPCLLFLIEAQDIAHAERKRGMQYKHGKQLFQTSDKLKLRPIQHETQLFRFIPLTGKKEKVTSFHCSKLLLECQIPQGISLKIFLAHNFPSNTPLLQEEHVQVYFFELYLDFQSVKKSRHCHLKSNLNSAFLTNSISARPSSPLPYRSLTLIIRN